MQGRVRPNPGRRNSGPAGVLSMFEEPIRKRGMASLTPLIDVVFLLLIFLIVLRSFVLLCLRLLLF